MASVLQHVAWESCPVEPTHDPALESCARRRQGILAPAIPYCAAAPWLARAVLDLRPEYRRMGDEGATIRYVQPTARRNLRLDRRRVSKRSSIASELERLPIPRQLEIPAPDFVFALKRPYRPFPINR